MAGRPYEALRFANSVRGNLGLKPAKRLVTTGSNPIISTITQGSKTTTATMRNGVVTATRTGRNGTTVQRSVPEGAQAYLDFAL